MRKILFFLSAAMILTSCSKDSNSEDEIVRLDPKKGYLVNRASVEHGLVGLWKSDDALSTYEYYYSNGILQSGFWEHCVFETNYYKHQYEILQKNNNYIIEVVSGTNGGTYQYKITTLDDNILNYVSLSGSQQKEYHYSRNPELESLDNIKKAVLGKWEGEDDYNNNEVISLEFLSNGKANVKWAKTGRYQTSYEIVVKHVSTKLFDINYTYLLNINLPEGLNNTKDIESYEISEINNGYLLIAPYPWENKAYSFFKTNSLLIH